MRKALAVPLILLWLPTACLPVDPYQVTARPNPPADPGPGSFGKLPQSPPQPPRLRRLDNGHFRVTRPWNVQLGDRNWTVQRGYTSNGITAPRSLKQSLGDGVEHPETWAAVFHDWLFTQPGMSRAAADRYFYDLLIAYGVPQQKARLMYTTVSAYSLAKARS
jgi:hypothetical protein